MNVQRICFLGTRTGNFEETAALFRDVLGLGNVHAEPGRSFFQPVSTASRSIEEDLVHRSGSHSCPGRLQSGAALRPRSPRYDPISELPASLPGLLFARQDHQVTSETAH